MKKVGILTFHWADDFGAMLQTYGLKTALQNMGFNVEIIPYSNSNLKGRYNFLPKQVANTNRKLFIGDYNLLYMFRNCKHISRFALKKKRMTGFRRRFLSSKHYISDVNSLNTDQYDAILIGSDQVWNPQLTIGLDNAYLGNVRKNENTRIIAYAASFGKETLDEKDGKELGNAIDKNFYAVSLREQSSIPFLQKYTKKNLCAMPDPTLLLTSEEWGEFVKNNTCTKKSDEKYVIYHATEYNREMIEYAEKLAERSGAVVKNIRILPNGPLEFLQMIRDTEYVVTNSFHGTVFAILFEKRFVVFSHSDKNARLYDLLLNLGLEDKLSDRHELPAIDRSVDWVKVREKADNMRKSGLKYLIDSIGDQTDE